MRAATLPLLVLLLLAACGGGDAGILQDRLVLSNGGARGRFRPPSVKFSGMRPLRNDYRWKVRAVALTDHEPPPRFELRSLYASDDETRR